ncbi:hypothetical protein CPB84DRAFT_1847946 [Gymnopilus junonius]|uniref:Nephrocystin 3-like N-terminal domain-containing protein n=1 Tax=Gymnopilus junonius TaxID=109634 RepID=A0A9P5NM92_GYMJU|nr:hypothetical protein CPB84DRAFT_1847946 [Gymnopilus junonius]
MSTPGYSTDSSDSYNSEITKSIVGGRGNVNFMFNFGEMGALENTQVLAALQQRIVSGAFHNSDERYDPPKCHPHTREAVLKKIMNWVKNAQKPSRFMWLYGPAGSGKSAIAQTIAEMTVTGRNEKTYLVTTLVYQMILVIPEIRDSVIKALQHNPMVFSTSLKAQIQALIIKPLNDVLMRISNDQDRQAFMSRPHFIIIDGLDECNDEEAQAYIIESLLYAVQQLSVPLFFLTTTLVLDDTYHPLDDIKVLLVSKFDNIKRKHPARRRFPNPWPTEEAILELVNKSSGQFIYATTVIKYIESRRHLPPDRLHIILGLSDPGNDTPFAELDVLYNHILSSVYDIEEVTKLFMVLLFSDLPKSPLKIEEFIFCRPGEIDIILSDLHSLIVVPPAEDIRTELRISHASLGDFLRDRTRSAKFFIDGGVAHAEILRFTLKHFTHRDRTDRITANYWTSQSSSYFATAAHTKELMDDLYDFELVSFFDFMTRETTASPEAQLPMRWGNKVPVDDRWPNVAKYFFWLQKLGHPDPSKDFHGKYQHAFSTWLYTQLTRFYSFSSSHFPSTRLLLTLVTLPNFYSISCSTDVRPIHEFVDAVRPWPDINTQRWRDPVHIFDVYTSSGEAGAWYYAALGEFLTDKERAKEYFVDKNLYAELALVVFEFYVNVSLTKQTCHCLCSRQYSRDRQRQEELLKFLREHPLRSSDPEDQLYIKKDEVADQIDAFLSA